MPRRFHYPGAPAPAGQARVPDPAGNRRPAHKALLARRLERTA